MTDQKILVTGVTPQDRLNSLGPVEIINLVGSGMRLRVHGNSKKIGLLNSIDVSEQEFINWMASQPEEIQRRYAEAVKSAGSNITTDLLYRSIDVIDEIDEMIEKMGDRGATKSEKWRLTLLESKHKLATDTLRQLAQIQKIKQDSDQGSLPPPQQAMPSGKVIMSDEQKAQIEKLKKQKAGDKDV